MKSPVHARKKNKLAPVKFFIKTTLFDEGSYYYEPRGLRIFPGHWPIDTEKQKQNEFDK